MLAQHYDSDMTHAAALALYALLAQDAGSVLRTFVGYNTQKASLPLSEEQKKEAERLSAAAQQASTAGKFDEATRLLHQGLAVMQQVEWTPAVELASSLEAKADHAIVGPGQKVAIALTPLYRGATPEKLAASVFLISEGSTGTAETLAVQLTVDSAKLGALPIAIPPGTAAGNYFLETRLTGLDGVPHPKARAAFVKRVPVRVANLAAEAARLDARLASAKVKHPTAEYTAELYQRADRGEVNPHRYDFAQEFARAHQLLDAAAAGRDPLAGAKGDLRGAYRSAVDQTLQPYRVFVPERYDGKTPRPLVVALHGMGGDENSMFDLYRAGVIKQEAERLGFFVVCPKGRESASMYRGKAETDVLDVLAEVRRDFKIDASRIYLMGHSMGGFGTWSIAMKYPGLFAALGPIAGGGSAAGLEKIKHVPQYVVHGDNDKTVPVAASRTMVEAARKLGVKLVYVEVPGGSHSGVVVPQFGPMFDFFAEQAREAAAGK